MYLMPVIYFESVHICDPSFIDYNFASAKGFNEWV